SADAEDHDRPDAARRQAGSARRRGSPRAAADILRNDRAAGGKGRLRGGRRFWPRRLRRRAIAVLRQHGGAVRRGEQQSFCLFRAAESTALFRAGDAGGRAVFPDGAQRVLSRSAEWLRQTGPGRSAPSLRPISPTIASSSRTRSATISASPAPTTITSTSPPISSGAGRTATGSSGTS